MKKGDVYIGPAMRRRIVLISKVGTLRGVEGGIWVWGAPGLVLLRTRGARGKFGGECAGQKYAGKKGK